MLNNQALEIFEQKISVQLRQALTFDNIVKDNQDNIIAGGTITVSKSFSFDIQGQEEDEHLLNLKLDCLQKYIRIFASVEACTRNFIFFILPVIRQHNSAYICSLILIEVVSYKNQTIGYAQCLDNNYQLPKELKIFLGRHHIEIFDNLEQSMNFEDSLHYIKQQSLIRPNLFSHLSKNELHIIKNFNSHLRDINEINITLKQTEHQKITWNKPLIVILKNRLALIQALQDKLSDTEWFNTNRIIYVGLLNKFYTGINRYLNEDGFLIYNISFYKKYERLGAEINNPYLFFSEYTWFEYQMLIGLNDYIFAVEDNLNHQRQQNIEWHFTHLTNQEYLKFFLGESTTQCRSIASRIEASQNYIQQHHPAKKIMDLKIIAIQYNYSELGHLLQEKLKNIEASIKTVWGRFIIKESANSEDIINYWFINSLEDDILFVKLSQSNWTIYRKLSNQLKKINISIDGATISLLDKLINYEDVSFEDGYYLRNWLTYRLYPKMSLLAPKSEFAKQKSNFMIPPKEEGEDSLQDKALVLDTTNQFSSSSYEANPIQLLHDKISALEVKIQSMEDNIGQLKKENRQLILRDIENNFKVMVAKTERFNMSMNGFNSLINILTELETQLNIYQTGTINCLIIDSIVKQLNIIESFSELKRNKHEIKSLFNHQEIYICYYQEGTLLPDLKAPIILMNKNNNELKLYGNMPQKYQIHNLPQSINSQIFEVIDQSSINLQTVENSKIPSPILCNPIVLDKLYKSFKENSLHDFQMDTQQILNYQKSIIEKCQLLMKVCADLKKCTQEAGTNIMTKTFSSTPQ